jgi:hypothetical protein
MSIYTVHLPPLSRSAGERLQRAEFVRDGFSRGAFLLGPFWMLARRMVVEAALLFALQIGIALAMHALRFNVASILLALVLLAFLVGLEASSIRRFQLWRRGFTEAGVIAAENAEAAERRFFEAELSNRHPADVGDPGPDGAPRRGLAPRTGDASASG